METFGAISNRHGSDRNTTHTYGPIYDTLFPPESRRGIRRVLEIGIMTGAGLRTLAEFFPEAEVVGVDLDPGCVGEGRIGVLKADACDPGLGERLPGPWDLILDDASHDPADQRRTFLTLRRHLDPRGLYLVEDVRCGVRRHDVFPGVRPSDCREIDLRGIRGRFDDRMLLYAPGPRFPDGLGAPRAYGGPHPKVVYHAALMPGWRDIVAEQLALAAAVDLPGDWLVSVAGPEPDREEFAEMLGLAGVVADATESRDDPATDYEFPALSLAWKHARASERPLIYWHTKGASQPADGARADWRRAMGAAVVGAWRDRCRDLEAGHDASGWARCPERKFFAGNFWAMTAALVRELPDPARFRDTYNARGGPWGDRWGAEFWAAEGGGSRVSLAFDNSCGLDEHSVWVCHSTAGWARDIVAASEAEPCDGRPHRVRE